jgi:hypothetical protein
MPDELQLTPDEQDVETALRSLRPAPARLKLAVEPADVRVTRRPRVSRLRYWHVAAAAAIAFVLAAWFVAQRRGNLFNHLKRHWAAIDHKLHGDPTPRPPQPPTLLAYRMALAQSPDDLDALLAQHASMANASLNPSPPATVLTPWNADLYPSRGEL